MRAVWWFYTTGFHYVSILVFVELALDEYSWQLRKDYRQVSILVFVELALDASFIPPYSTLFV